MLCPPTVMFAALLTAVVVDIAAVAAAEPQGDAVPIVWQPAVKRDSLVAPAINDFSTALARLYRRHTFPVQADLPPTGAAIVLGDLDSQPALREWLGSHVPQRPESYVVEVPKRDGRDLAVVAGHDHRGMIYGLYALLEKLGCGFYLSYDAFPAPRDTFSFDGWQLADAPLVKERIVFDWHNFLSGCSTWNLPEWQQWIAQSQKQGYNAVMVHAYGNNPMFAFEFAGREKPVGYLSTTIKGRDWSTQHVDDVRRLWGGTVFDGPVFGPAAGMVPDDQRVAATRELMHDAFAAAQRRAMDVYFAVDVDTVSANPQSLIQSLPESARLAIQTQSVKWMNQEGGPMWLANPDTPEGYTYYKAQVDALLRAYPQISCIVVWFRTGGTPWMELKPADFSPAWQTQYAAELAKTPAAAKLWHAPSMFAIGRIVAAFQRAVKENGNHVEVAAGTWQFAFLPAADHFFPPGVKLIGLDYNVLHDRSQLSTAELRRDLRLVAEHRPIVPVVWAQHDDGNYVGRPYTPFDDFHAKLADCGASGFGIIHWTTRPLDLYFKSLARQVWQRTKDEPLATTCDAMAERSFGPAAGKAMGQYLRAWITAAPKFGRETSDYFIDRTLPDVDQTIAACGARIALLDQAATAPLDDARRRRWAYCKGMEEFIATFFATQDAYQRAQAALKANDLPAARAALSAAQPAKVIEQFAATTGNAGITRGEQGLVVSLNLRWLPHFVRLRQQLGTEPVRYCFGPTSHDPLAQSAGAFTFHFDADHNVWQRLGERETGANTYTLPADVQLARGSDVPAAYEEICRSGIETDKPLALSLGPILARDGRGGAKSGGLPPGRYNASLIFADATSTAAGQRVFDVAIGALGELPTYRFAPIKAGWLRIACHGNQQNAWNSIWEVRAAALAGAGADRATASKAVAGYPAANAIDGKANTRWAAEGDNEWLQLRLNPQTPLEQLGIAWYAGDQRQYKFDLLVSDDGQAWRKLAYTSAADAVTPRARLDLFALAGRQGRVVVKTFPVELDRAGPVTLTLTPQTGKAMLCGVVLTRSPDEPPRR